MRNGKVARLSWLGAVLFVIGTTIGSVLKATHLIPTIAIRWSDLEARDYRPGSVRATTGGDEIVLVYIGSGGCGWSNLPEMPQNVRDAKTKVANHAREAGTGFAALGVALDPDAIGGWAHLEKFGLFDEAVVGKAWRNTASQKYIFGPLSGTAATPQLLVTIRSANGMGTDERLIVRKVGSSAIARWVAAGAPLPPLRGP